MESPKPPFGPVSTTRSANFTKRSAQHAKAHACPKIGDLTSGGHSKNHSGSGTEIEAPSLSRAEGPPDDDTKLQLSMRWTKHQGQGCVCLGPPVERFE